MNRDITLQRLKNTNFPVVYQNFITGNGDANDHNNIIILSLAILLINSGNLDVRKLGYRIIVLYCNKYGDYLPLYDVSLNIGLFPISKFILSMQKIETNNQSIFQELNESFLNNYMEDNSKCLSFEQKELLNFFEKNTNNSVAVVAPTSYGKTDLILSFIVGCEGRNVCIITPTKSLLAQTKQRITNLNLRWLKKIVSHPEMYNESDKNIVAVLTQERALRLLRNASKLSFDYVIIDEAHNLLDNHDRDILLASVLILLQKRNPNVVLKYLTPFLNDTENLKIKFLDKSEENIGSFYIQEYIKTEKYYLYNTKEENQTLEFYDQFMDEFYILQSGLNYNEISFVEHHRAKKNIIYLNKPINIEEFAEKLSEKRRDKESDIIDKACNDIADYIHPQYNLIQYLKKGVIYHHGSVPEAIRLYIERLYSDTEEIEYVITNSTLLEGVNLPAERMFILDNKKGNRNLSQSSFKNLIGRVCRFSDVFSKSKSNLHGLEPHIYIINSRYCAKNANLKTFLVKVSKISKIAEDEPQNVLLKATSINKSNEDKYRSALEFLENYEEGTVKAVEEIRLAKTDIGKACFLNNVTELPIFDIEHALQETVDEYHCNDKVIGDASILMEVIDELFLSNIIGSDNGVTSQNILRLRNQSAQRFYSMFLDWRLRGASYAEMIHSFLNHWEKTIAEGNDPIVFVGRWGDITQGNGVRTFWTNICSKSTSQRINLAIVRIKEEQDFLDNVIIKFIEVLNDVNLLDESFYCKIKYGTDDKLKITLVKNGVSLSLANLIVDQYLNLIKIDSKNSIVEFSNDLIEALKNNDENQILLNEALYYVR